MGVKEFKDRVKVHWMAGVLLVVASLLLIGTFCFAVARSHSSRSQASGKNPYCLCMSASSAALCR